MEFQDRGHRKGLWVQSEAYGAASQYHALVYLVL